MIGVPIRPRLPKPAMADPNIVPVEFSPTSKARLAEINPDLAQLMIAVEAQYPDAFEIGEGVRSKERQAQMVAEGKSQTMNSKHPGGNAVDIYMLGPDGQPNWDFEAYRPIADTAKATAAAMGLPDLVWGGDWKTLKDGVHFQLGGNGGGGTVSAGPAASVAGAAPLSFGTEVPGVQDPSALGLAEIFGMQGPSGLSMGGVLPGLPGKRPATEQMLLAQGQQDTDTKRKIALADLMRF